METPEWFDRLPQLKKDPFRHPRRELATEEEFKKKVSIEFNGWVHGISPDPTVPKGWFRRDKGALDISVLPTDRGGVYEIGVFPEGVVGEEDHVVVVYVGKATKVRPEAKGATLRKRIYTDYCLHGSHIKDQLRSFLEQGWHVFFRWVFLDRVNDCRAEELKCLNAFDYAFNTESNGVSRSKKVCWIKHGRTVSAIEYLEARDRHEVEQLIAAFKRLSTKQKALFLSRING